jgi:hypothetical protein
VAAAAKGARAAKPGRQSIHRNPVQRLLRLLLPLLERPRLDELRCESEWALLLLERPELAPIRPLWLLSVFFVGILNLRQIPASRAKRIGTRCFPFRGNPLAAVGRAEA